jgi:hypothetical protein
MHIDYQKIQNKNRMKKINHSKEQMNNDIRTRYSAKRLKNIKFAATLAS